MALVLRDKIRTTISTSKQGQCAVFSNKHKQGGRRHCALYFTCPQSFHLKFPYSLAKQVLGLLLDLDWSVHVSATYCNLQKG